MQKGFNKISGLAKNNSLLRTSQAIVTFLLVYFAWIFFRANNTTEALVFIENIFEKDFWNAPLNLFRFAVDMHLSFISIGLLILIEILEEKYSLYHKIKLLRYSLIKWLLLALLIFTILLLGVWEEADFLYFQF